MVSARSMPWLLSFAWAYSNCEERKSRITKWKILAEVEFEPGTFPLRSKRAKHCASKFDIYQVYRVLHAFAL